MQESLRESTIIEVRRIPVTSRLQSQSNTLVEYPSKIGILDLKNIVVIKRCQNKDAVTQFRSTTTVNSRFYYDIYLVYSDQRL